MESNNNKVFGGKYYAHSLRRGFTRLMGKLWYFHLIKKQKNTRILVVLHLFYMDAWKEICEYLKNLSPYRYSLIVTCMEGCYDEETLTNIEFFKPDVKILKCENIGWDLLPFILALRSVNLSDYDVIFKLQSKGTKRQQIFLYGQYFRLRTWFLNLFEGCIGAFTVHTTIRDLIDKDKDIGLVAAKNLIVEDPIHKQNMVEAALVELGLPKPQPYRFVSGTCFAVRAKLMEQMRNLQIPIEKFHSTGFSFAHRMERIICFPPIWSGLKITGPSVMRFRRSLWVFYPFAWWWRKYYGARMLKDSRVNIEDQFAFRSIEPRLIKNWEFVKIPVGDIRRRMSPEGECIPLSETLPYQYLEKRDPKIYDEYCKYNQQVWNVNLMSRERFDALIDSLDIHGDTQEKNIVVGEDNVIFDGQHRSCWTLHKYGPTHEINVLKFYVYNPYHSIFMRIWASLSYRISKLLGI
jgi:hypothetical protein